MYSVNQVNQLYVVGSVLTGDNHVTSASTKGALEGPIKAVNGEFVYFKYMGAGGPIATDRIKNCKVKWISYTPAASMQKPLRTWTIAMNSNVNSGNPVVGQDYIISFDFKHYFGMSDEDQYFKQAAARAFTTTASDLYRDLAMSLAKNMSREIDQPFSVQLTTSSDPVDVTAATRKDTLSGSYTGIKLTEVLQPWELGRYKYLRPDFTINYVPVTVSGVDYRDWATTTESTSGSVIKNGMETADLEWFCMGERGDQYRGKDWPMSIVTPATLMVDPTKEYNYLIIHFWDDIDNEGPQKSERDMTFVADASGAVDLFAIGSAIADATGVEMITNDGAAISSTKVATPVVTRGTDTNKNKITSVTCATPGAKIYYTGPGATANDPTSASTEYTNSTGTLTLTSTNIAAKFIAIKEGMDNSDIVAEAYTA